MFDDLSLNHRILKDIKKALKLCERKALVVEMVIKEQISVNRACKIVSMTRSMYYYSSKKNDEAIIEKLNELSEKYPTLGFDLIMVKYV